MRIVAKTMTYGLMHIAVAFCVTLFVTRSLQLALAISLLEPFLQIAFFSVHEYLWSRKHPGVPSPHKGCCSSAFDLAGAAAFFSRKTA